MADQGKWYKLHVGWDDDPHISALSRDSQLNWCKFGAYVKEHGTNGSIVLVPPAQPLQNRFAVTTFQAVINCIKQLPNYCVNEESDMVTKHVTSVTVTCKNWQQYQGDFSRDRMRKLRSRVTAKRRREVDVEEKRGEESPPNPQTPLPSATSTSPTNGTTTSTPNGARNPISTLKINGKPYVPELEIPEEERMSHEEMESIKQQNMRLAVHVSEDDQF